jgi:hypothetical protein
VLLCRQRDQPGIVGTIGMLLAKDNVNINFMTVGGGIHRGGEGMVRGGKGGMDSGQRRGPSTLPRPRRPTPPPPTPLRHPRSAARGATRRR